MKKFTNIAKLMLGLPIVLFFSVDSNDFYKIVAQHRMPSYQDQQKAKADFDQIDKTNLVKEPLLLPAKHYFTLKNFLQTHGNDKFLPYELWTETSLLTRGSNAISLFDAIDRTLTPFGASMLTQWLITPESNKNLTQRQDMMKFLEKNKDLDVSFTQILKIIKGHEHAYFNFFNPDPNIEHAIDQTYYFSENSWSSLLGLTKLNTSAIGQNLVYTTERLKSPAYVALAAYGAAQALGKAYNYVADPTSLLAGTAAFGVLSGITSTRTATKFDTLSANQQNYIKENKPELYDALRSEQLTDETGNPLQKGEQLIPGANPSKGPEEQKINITETILNDPHLKEKLQNLSPLKKAQVAAATFTGITGGAGNDDSIIENIGDRLKSTWDFATYYPNKIEKREKTNTQLLNYMHSQLIDIGYIARQLKELNTILIKRPGLAKNLSNSKYIQGLFDAKSTDISDNMRYLIGLLLTNTFTGEPSWFSQQGRVIAAYKLMKDGLNEWTPVMQALGEIDALLSCTKLYDEYKNNAQHFVFVDYPKTLKLHDGYLHPQLHIEKMWNPINASLPIHEKTITLKETPHNIALVDSKEALQTTALAIIMASTLGIAPAHSMKLISFANIAMLMQALSNPQLAIAQADNIIDMCTHDNHNKLNCIFIDGTKTQAKPLTDKIQETIKTLPNTAIIIAQ